jgi:5-methylcytosine-specific restriction protein A
MKYKYCNHINCGQLIPEGEKYCQKHQPIPRQSSAKPFAKAFRSSNLYNTSRWRTLRKKIIKKFNSVCQKCGATGNVVDHIYAHRGDEDLFFNEENCTVLCYQCHSVKTAQEISERKKRY